VTLIDLTKKVEKLLIDNSPTVLTVLGVTGTVTTAYLTGRAGFRAAELLTDECYARQAPVPTKECVALTWKLYIPAATVGTVTVASIIMANRIGARRAAALAAAYTLSEKAFVEYREKIADAMGHRKEQIARDEIAQDRVRANPVDNSQLMMVGTNEVLCYDMFTGRYFNSSMERLKAAQNDINYAILNDGYAALSDFYTLVGLPNTASSEEVGWTLDKLLELRFSSVLSEHNQPCLAVDFAVAPVRNYHKFN
jgi:hypothetical protein